MQNKNHAIVIMAGGSGTRLWPLSRKKSPKQFQSLVSEKTLLRETFDRVSSLVSIENIFICSTELFRENIQHDIPELSQENFILEPSAQGTCSAIALATRTLLAKNPHIVIATIASDHAIANPEEFVSVLALALETAEENPEKLITIGIRPTRPDTGLGYIQSGSVFALKKGKNIHFVESFKEKPDHETAKKYILDPRYSWNSGYFIYHGASLIRWIETFVPETFLALENIFSEQSISHEKRSALYATCPTVAIDIALVEKLGSDSRLVISSDLEWNDVGTWDTLYDFLVKKSPTTTLANCPIAQLESAHNFIHAPSKKLVALHGIKDLVIVDTGDTLFITQRNLAPNIKNLLEEIKKSDQSDLL